MPQRHSRLKLTSVLALSSLLLTSCAEIAEIFDPGRSERGVEIADYPRRPAAIGPELQLRGAAPPLAEGITRVELIRGTRSPVKEQPPAGEVSTPPPSDEPVTVNFADADIREVARTVLADLYGLPYSIDPNVQGRITFETSAPVPKSRFLATFETVLRVNGFALIRQGDIYTIVPLAEAPMRARGLEVLDKGLAPGIGFRQVIVPLQFVSPEEIRKILEPLSPQGGIVLSDSARNVMVLSGTRTDIEAMMDVIRTFDTDWMASMSFAILTPANVDAATLARELSVVFDNPKNPSRDLVDLIPLQRLNGVLAVSSEPELLQDVSRWARRLDRRAVGGGRQIFYYRVQNAKATELLKTLGPVMGFEGEGALTGAQPAVMPVANMQSPEAAPQVPGAPEMGTPAPQPAVLGGPTGPKISADDHNNALVILATAQEYSLLEDALRQMDTLPLQVLIEATIAEVTLNDRLSYGVQWFFESGKQSYTLSDVEGGDLVAKFPGFSFAHISPSTQVVINALSSVTDVDVVSTPRIMALTNQAALIQVGDQVPIITQSAVSVQDPGAPIVSTVEMRDTGVILRVTPRINNSGLIVLDVEQEVSDVVATTTSNLNTPTIQQRRIKSTVAVRDGETAILGGLIRNSLSDGRSGVPFLKDIPIVGELFSSTSSTRRRTELLVFLKPRVVSSSAEARQVLEELSGQVKSLQVRRIPRAIRKP